jgi:hypothetical protein
VERDPRPGATIRNVEKGSSVLMLSPFLYSQKPDTENRIGFRWKAQCVSFFCDGEVRIECGEELHPTAQQPLPNSIRKMLCLLICAFCASHKQKKQIIEKHCLLGKNNPFYFSHTFF